MPWRLEGVLYSLTVATENPEDSIVGVRYASEDAEEVADPDSAFASPVSSTFCRQSGERGRAPTGRKAQRKREALLP